MPWYLGADNPSAVRRCAFVVLDTGQYHQVVRCAWESSESELVERPVDLTDLVVVEFDEWSLLREVEERIRIDLGDDGRDAIDEQLVDGGRGNLGDVEPAAQRQHHDRPVQRRDTLEVGRQDVVDVHRESASTT
jgi:hypothetical protein